MRTRADDWDLSIQLYLVFKAGNSWRPTNTIHLSVQTLVWSLSRSTDTWYNSITEALDQSRGSPWGICCGQSGTRAGLSLSTSAFPCQFHSTNAPFSHAASRAGTISPLAAHVRCDSFTRRKNKGIVCRLSKNWLKSLLGRIVFRAHKPRMTRMYTLTGDGAHARKEVGITNTREGDLIRGRYLLQQGFQIVTWQKSDTEKSDFGMQTKHVIYKVSAGH
jgi:hypothetical protein